MDDRHLHDLQLSRAVVAFELKKPARPRCRGDITDRSAALSD